MLSEELVESMDFRDYVLERVLEEPGMVREMYLSLNESDESIKEDEIEWFRKVYSHQETPCYSFTFIARGEYSVYFVIYGLDEHPDFQMLEDYAKENYRGYVDEYCHGDEISAPVFRVAMLAFCSKEEI